MGFHLLCSCSYLMLCLCYWRKFPTQGTPPLSLIPQSLLFAVHYSHSQRNSCCRGRPRRKFVFPLW
ncbi:unnamed protein product [Brassica oleracea var. botrytis]